MSTAHRPNFDPAKGRESKAHLSQQRTALDIPTHTKLKFRQPATSTSSAASSSSSGNVARRDLKRELEEAEWEAKNRKRIKAGLEPLPPPATGEAHTAQEALETDEQARRRKEAIQQAIELDKDSDSESESESEEEGEGEQDNQASHHSSASASSDSDSDSSSEEDEEGEDEQALLLRELEKIRAERSAAAAARSSSSTSTQQLSREQEIAQGNPLLNLQSHFQPATSSSNSNRTTEKSDFAVKKRWDDDVIFKNQASAAGNTGNPNASKPGGANAFVNDLTRSDFHRKFMNRYIK